LKNGGSTLAALFNVSRTNLKTEIQGKEFQNFGRVQSRVQSYGFSREKPFAHGQVRRFDGNGIIRRVSQAEAVTLNVFHG
jgi:hypothetical protein